MYCVVHNAIEQAKVEQAVDIFQAVKNVRMQRPGSIPTLVNTRTFTNTFMYGMEIVIHCMIGTSVEGRSMLSRSKQANFTILPLVYIHLTMRIVLHTVIQNKLIYFG